MQFMFSRKSGIVLAALLGVQLILPASGWALTGRDVALKADQVDTSRTSDMSMAMIIKRGDQQLVRFMAMKKKKFPDSEKQHIRFLEPGDIRNTAYLTWSYRDINKDDDMWVYMPAESLVRRISGGSKKGSFMRSDYANEDISRREVDKDTYTLLPDEALSGVDCHVLEAKAVFPEKTNYSKRIIWIILNFLKNIFCRSARLFISVENHINAIRHIIRVNSHTFKVVSSVNHNTDLCVMRIT